MTNDELALYSFIAFLIAWAYLLIAKFVIEHLCQFRIVRISYLDELYKTLAQLEDDNNLLRQGIVITENRETGQIKFDLPTFEPEFVYIPAVITKEKGIVEHGWMKWLATDWQQRQLDRVLVLRRKQYLWVDVPLRGDKVIEKPYEWIVDEKSNNGHRNGKRRHKHRKQEYVQESL